MGSGPVPKDMTAPNWGRTYRRLMRLVAELREAGCEVRVPDQFEKPPAQRLRTGGIVPPGRTWIMGERGPELTLPSDHDPVL